MLPHSG